MLSKPVVNFGISCIKNKNIRLSEKFMQLLSSSFSQNSQIREYSRTLRTLLAHKTASEVTLK